MPTGISYCDETWNPVIGCEKCSVGCLNCFAEKMAARLSSMGVEKYSYVIKAKHIDKKRPWNGKIFCDEKALEIPLHWRKPRTILVPSMGDWLHPKVPFEFILKIIGVSLVTPWHTYLFLTKRIDRAVLFLEWWREEWRKNPILWGKDALALQAVENLPTNLKKANQYWLDNFDQSKRGKLDYPIPCPQPNIHFGVTISTQKEADEQIPLLLQIPAAHRWISAEPLLSEINFRWTPYAHQATGETYRQYLERNGSTNEYEALRKISRIVIGCESGPKRRPCKLEWIRSIVQQCKAAGIRCWVKQIPWPKLDYKKLESILLPMNFAKPEDALSVIDNLCEEYGSYVEHDMEKFPKDLQVRELTKDV